MSFVNEKIFSADPQILFDLNNANTLYGVHLRKDAVSQVGRYRKVMAGCFLGSNKRPIARANTIAPYTSGNTAVVVDNPWLFLPGDVLYEIGDHTESYLAEQQAVANATQELGTVTAVNAGTENYEAFLTPNNVTVGDVYVLKIEEIEVRVTAKSTDVAELIGAIEEALKSYLRPERSSLELVNIIYSDTNISFVAKEPGIILTIVSSVAGTGTFDLLIPPGAGTLTITPHASNNDQGIGAKIGVIGDRPLGIIAQTQYLTNDYGQPLVADLAVYDSGNIYKKNLPYLDGDLASAMPNLKFISPYG